MMSFLLSTYIVVASKVKAEKEMIEEVREIYAPKQTLEEAYNSYFANPARLPAGFQEVEYIESTGTQYIDTKIIANDISEIDLKMQLTNNSEIYGIVGGGWSENNSTYQIIYNSRDNTISAKWGECSVSLDYNNQIHNVVLSNKQISIDDINSMHSYSINDNRNVYIFARRSNDLRDGIGNYSFCRIFNCKIINNNNMETRDFIPCKSTTTVTDVKGNSCPVGTVGLYDTVTKEFYTNDGIGTFIAGLDVGYSSNETIPIYTVEQLLAIGTGEQFVINGKIYTFSKYATYVLKNDLEFDADDWQDVLGQGKDWLPIGKTNIEFEGNNNKITVTKLDNSVVEYNKTNKYLELRIPIEYQEVEYIESTGTQYIDTKIIANDISEIDLKMQLTNNSEIYGIVGGGWSENNSTYQIIYNNRNNTIIARWGECSVSLKYDNQIHNVVLSNKQISIDDINSTHSYSINDNRNVYIFARRSNDLRDGIESYSFCRIFNCKIINNNNMETRNFNPCKTTTTVTDVKGNSCPVGTVGLYDTVTEEFYTNDGGGTFIAGPDVD